MASVWINRVLIFLGAAGIFITGVLSYSVWQNVSVPCGGNQGCATVQSSPWSEIGGVSVSYLGLLGFVVLFAFAVVRLISPPSTYRTLGVLGFAMAGGGTLFSVYLTVISISVIQQKCIWCLATLATIVVTTIAYGALLQADAPQKTDANVGMSVAAAAFLIATGAAYGVGYRLETTIPEEMMFVRAGQYTLEEVLPKESKIRGSANAKVTVVEFADINCPACRETYPMVKRILAKHGKNVRLAFRHYPLTEIPGHETSTDAAVIAEYAADNGLFWKYMDTVMDEKVTGRVKSIDGLFGIAGEVGLSRVELRLMFNSVDDEQRERFTALVQSVTDDVNVARKLEIRMTPTFIVYAEGVEPRVVPANMLDMTLMQAPFKQIIAGK